MVFDRKECDYLIPILIALMIILVLIWFVGYFYRRDFFIGTDDHLRSMIEGEVMSVREARRLLEKNRTKPLAPTLVAFLTDYVNQNEDRIQSIEDQIGTSP